MDENSGTPGLPEDDSTKVTALDELCTDTHFHGRAAIAPRR
jgi:hypothetical protein